METLLTVFGCSGTTNLSQEEQRFGKVPGNFLLQVKGQLLLFFCGRKHPRQSHNHKESQNKKFILKASRCNASGWTQNVDMI